MARAALAMLIALGIAWAADTTLSVVPLMALALWISLRKLHTRIKI